MLNYYTKKLDSDYEQEYKALEFKNKVSDSLNKDQKELIDIL